MLYTITVPSTVKRYPIPESVFKRRIMETRDRVCAITGGATLTLAIGAWIDDNGQVVIEDVCKVETYSDNPDHAELLRQLARDMARDYSQDSVLFTYAESVPVFITENIA